MDSHFPRKVWREIACSFQNISIVIVQKAIETFIRFQDEYDYEYEIFSILSSARAWTSVILAGKRGSRRHSTTSFSESVVVAGTSYQMLEVLAFCNRERAQPPSMTITVLTFLVKKSTIKNSRVSIFRKNFKSNLVLVVVLVVESKAL